MTAPKEKAARPGGGEAASESIDNTAQLTKIAIATDWHRVGLGYSVMFDLRDGQANATWAPHMPSPRELRRIIKSGRYDVARHHFLVALSEKLGGAVVCLEV